MGERRQPKGLGERVAQLHLGGPNFGGPSYRDIAKQLTESNEFGKPISYSDARESCRRFLSGKGWARWGVPKGADEPGLEINDHKNYREITYTPGGRPRVYTYEQLVDLAKIDEDEWVNTRFEVTFYEQGYKDERTKLEYIDGVATGTIDKRGGKVEQLCRIFAQFVRRHPVPVRPSIQPVQAEKSYEFPAPRKAERGFKRYLAGGDLHFGFMRDPDRPVKLLPLHDRKALSIFLQFAKEFDPDAIKLGGDLFDFGEISHYVTSPSYRFLMQPTIYELHWFLAQLRKTCPDADISAHEGNHDERMRRHQKQHSDWACDLKKATASEGPPALSVQNLVDMPRLAVRWIGDWPNDEDWEGDVRFVHGNIARKNPGDTAKAICKESDYSTFFFHIHREELATKTMWTARGPRYVFAATPGFLGRNDGVIPGRTSRQNWQKGFYVIDFYPDGYIDKRVVRIHNGKAVYQGHVYEGVEEVPDIVKDWGG